MARALVLTVVALLAGCTAPAEAPPEIGGHAAAVLFASASCDEGGSYVVWNQGGLGDRFGGILPEPFVYADATEDTGNPPITAWGEVPQKPLAGAYHAVLSCPTWSIGGVEKTDLLIAFVAVLIVPPPFDPAPIEREYLVGVIAANDPDVARALVGMGIAPDEFISASLSFDNDILRSTMQFGHHGDITSAVPIETHSEREAETMRFWLLANVEGGARPIALDFEDVGGTRHTASSPGYFDHRAPSAAPPAPGAPLHEFNSWALGYRDVARTVRIGPVVDTVVARADHG